MDVALIKVGALGDVVRTTSILPGLRRKYPNLRLVWITSKQATDLVQYHPEVHETMAAEDLADSGLETRSFDWVISLDDEMESCRIASALNTNKLTGAYLGRDRRRHYSADSEAWFGMGRLRPAAQGGLRRANELKRRNESSFQTILSRMLDLPGPIAAPLVVVPRTMKVRPGSWCDERCLQMFRAVVGVNTGAGGRWKFKKWREDQTVELVRALHDEFGVAVILLGGPMERQRNARILRAVNRPYTFAIPDDWSLLEFTEVLQHCDVIVTSDSLALHLATAKGVPVIVFFGPTSSAEIETFGRGEKVVTPLECRCCYLSTCQVTPNCMDSISPAVMLDAVRRWLPQKA